MTAEARVPRSSGTGLRAARAVLIGIGVAGLLAAAWITLTTVHAEQYGGVLLWLAAAVVLHDAVLAPLVWIANRMLRAVGRGVPAVVLAIVQVAVIVGVILTLMVVPELRAQRLGPRNPTVLPMDYGLHLALLWVVLALLTAAACALVLRRRRRA